MWPFSTKSEPKPEVAITARGDSNPPNEPSLIDPVRNLFRLYPSDTISAVRYKSILRNADAGYTTEFMELLDDVATDAHVASCLRTRKLAVAKGHRHVKPASLSAADRKIADQAQMFVESIPDWRQLSIDVLDAVYRGWSCNRPIWGAKDKAWWIVGHEPIESRFFRFHYGVEPLIDLLNAPPVPVPPGYLFHVHRDKPGPIVRGGLGRSVAKLWLYKSFALIDTASYLERFGHPHIQVNLPAGYKEGSPELERAKAAARSLVTDQVGLVPPNVTMTILETISKAATVRDVYLAFMEWCDRGISKAVLGHASAVEAGTSRLGGSGDAENASDMQQDLVELDAAQFGETLTTQLIGPWTRYHHGPNARVPRLEIDVSLPENQLEKHQAQKVRADTIAVLMSPAIGLKVSKQQIQDEFELEEPESEDDELGGADDEMAPNDEPAEEAAPAPA